MSETDVQSNEAAELAALKQRATQMGIQFRDNISLEKLRARVNEALEADAPEEEKEDAPVTDGKETAGQKRARLYAEQTALIRVVVRPNDQTKANHDGEFHRVSNKIVGTIGRMVSYNNENGWHIEKALYDSLKEKKLQRFRIVKDPVTRQESVIPELINQFNIEVLEPLTEEELEQLAQDQRARNAIG